MNIYEKILAIMQDVQYLAKDDHVSFGNTNYKALSEEKVTSIMRTKLIQYKLIVIPVEQTSSRTGSITHVDVKYRMINVESPEEFIEIVSCGDGADTQDKGSGKAMTYSFKYMWLRTFALPTGEDPDKISSEELDDMEKKAKDAAQKPGIRIPPKGDTPVWCPDCRKRIPDYFDGESLIKAADIAKRNEELYGATLCIACAQRAGK